MTDPLDRWIDEKLSNSASPKPFKISFGNKKKNHTSKKQDDSSKKPFAQKSQKPFKSHNSHNQKGGPSRGKFKGRKPFFKRGGTAKKATHVRIIPLGGLDEVGKNMMVIEYGSDIMIIDMGFQFPEEDMLGIDYVIPDISWLEKRKKDIRGVILTHGHLDHIGGIPYILPKLGFPKLHGTKLTMGLVEKRIEEFGLKKDTMMNVIDPSETLQLGPFRCKFFRVNHSIPDGVGIVIETPEGDIVHTGDFKFDATPADQIMADIGKMKALGQGKQVSVMFSDSTNATKPGFTISEEAIGQTLDMIIGQTSGRIIIASFASLIGRIQQILNSAVKHKKKVFVSGRSLLNNIEIAHKLGFLKIPQGLIHDLKTARKAPDSKTLILTTGSQGESVSALTRISLGSHKQVKIKKGDTVVISATPIIGNEKAIFVVIDNLTKLGAKVIHNKIMDVHTSGHGSQEDLKKMLSMVKPKNLVPVHGQYFMRSAHKDLAMDMGMQEKNTIMINNGDILELKNGHVTVSKETVDTNYIVVDGLGTGDIGSRTIMDRQILAENGVIVITLQVDRKTKRLKLPLHIETRGFIYIDETEKIIKGVKNEITKKYSRLLQKHQNPGIRNIKDYITSVVDKYTHRTIERRPLVMPIVVEV